MHEKTDVTVLDVIHRTEQAGLLSAAAAVRDGRALPANGGGFELTAAHGPRQVPWCVAKELATHRWSTAAVIAPVKRGGLLELVVQKVSAGPVGNRAKFGPFLIKPELSDVERSKLLLETVETPALASPADMAALFEHCDDPHLQEMHAWLRRQERVVGTKELKREAVEQRLRRIIELSRQFRAPTASRVIATTIHGAKNREFDGVVVIWPHQVRADPEYRRRMLYNAITRAKSWCAVIAQSRDQLEEPPFH